MSPHDRHSIAFLLTLGALPLGCPAPEGGDTTASTTGGPASDPSTTAETTSTSGTSDSGEATTQSMTTSSSTSTDATDESVGTDPDSSGTSETDGYLCEEIEVSDLCAAHAAHYVKCNPRYARYEAEDAMECTCLLAYYGMMYGAECEAAYEDYFACITATPCEELRDDLNDPCGTELEAFALECLAGGGTSGGR